MEGKQRMRTERHNMKGKKGRERERERGEKERG